MKILSVVGARPNFMKIGPFVEAINLWNDKNYKDLKNDLIARHLDVLMRTIPPGVERIAPA